MKTNFHNKNLIALSLAFMTRFKATRKWPTGFAWVILYIIMQLNLYDFTASAMQQTMNAKWGHIAFSFLMKFVIIYM